MEGTRRRTELTRWPITRSPVKPAFARLIKRRPQGRLFPLANNSFSNELERRTGDLGITGPGGRKALPLRNQHDDRLVALPLRSAHTPHRTTPTRTRQPCERRSSLEPGRSSRTVAIPNRSAGTERREASSSYRCSCRSGPELQGRRNRPQAAYQAVCVHDRHCPGGWCKQDQMHAGCRHRLEQPTTDQKVGGSNPPGRTSQINARDCSRCHHSGVPTRVSKVRAWAQHSPEKDDGLAVGPTE